MVTVLNLVLYNESSQDEQKMKAILERLQREQKHGHTVIQYFYTYSDTLEGLVDDVLYIKGVESLLPGVLDKTISAIEWCNHISFDYLVRSNISTVIDFNNLPYQELENHSIVYASPLINTLTWTDPGSGIHTDVYRGTGFASGTSIIMNRGAVDYLILNKDKINRDIIDDVSIGILMNSVTKPFQLSTPLIINDSSKLGVFYRNRSWAQTRKRDIKRMSEIVSILLDNLK